MSKRKQRKCRICKKRPPWQYKNCPPGICKRCYHSHVWPKRPGRDREVAALDLERYVPETYVPETYELGPELFEPEAWWDPEDSPF